MSGNASLHSSTGVTISVDLLDNLTLGDIEDVEELAGVGFGAFRDGGGVPAKAIRALAFVVRRKSEPGLTFEACRDMTMTELLNVLQTTPAPLGKLRAVNSAAS
jgi:hypothetical protein